MGGRKRGPGGSGAASPAAREAGSDTAGKTYRSIQAMWSSELADGKVEGGQVSDAQWYRKAKEYWETQKPTVDGMLGGLEKVHPVDVVGSRAFLSSFGLLEKANARASAALDVGGGIGRVTKHVLSNFFEKVDLLDSSQAFIDKSREYAADCKALDRRMCCPMEDFRPERGRYGLVWIQWCIIYLTDDDLIRFFELIADADVPVVVVKDNVTTKGFVVDKEDSSVTRSDAHMKRLFSSAGWVLAGEQLQEGFPEDLFDVKMYALTRASPATPPEEQQPALETSP